MCGCYLCSLKQNICCSAHLLFFWKLKKNQKHKRPAIPWPWLKLKGRIFQGGFPSSHSLVYSVFLGFGIIQIHLLLRSGLHVTLHQGGLMNFQHVKFQYFPGLLPALLRSSSFTTYVCAIRYFGCVFRPFPFPIFIAALLLGVLISPTSPQLYQQSRSP